jgi:arylsulfatase A-like enzyme
MLYEVSELQVPPNARLEFAFGLLEPRGGEVRFFIEACRGPRCQGIFDEVVDSEASGPGWQERSVELGSLTPGPFSLRFGAERLSEQGAFLPLFANPTVLAPAAPSEPRRPNVVLISLDTLRRDHLEAYGYARATAPFLGTRLAPRGVVFEDLAAEASTTDPSHMTLFTSLPSLVHGVVSGGMNRLSIPAVTLADQLREHGYQTAAFTENGPLAQERGFSIGFEAYRENKSGNLMRPRGLVEDTFGQARTWVATRGDRPFFVFLHTFQVHAPYSPPERYSRYFGEDEGVPTGAGASSAKEAPVDDYDREIRYVDDQLASLHAWFEEQGLDDRTYFIVLSDHGEEFFEHGSLGHATLPYEEVLQVPLILVGPDIPGPRRNRAPLHHVDLMPTLLDLAGVPAPAHLGGRSFAAWARGDASSMPGERPRFSTSWALPAGLDPPALAIRLGDRKLIRYRDASGERLLYFDLSTDPGELQELSEDGRASELLELSREFEAEAAEQRMQRLRNSETLGEGDPPLMDPEREDMLRSLGYLD